MVKIFGALWEIRQKTVFKYLLEGSGHLTLSNSGFIFKYSKNRNQVNFLTHRRKKYSLYYCGFKARRQRDYSETAREFNLLHLHEAPSLFTVQNSRVSRCAVSYVMQQIGQI